MSDPMSGPGKSATDARQGKTLGVMRWVLGIGILVAIVAMILVFKMS